MENWSDYSDDKYRKDQALKNDNIRTQNEIAKTNLQRKNLNITLIGIAVSATIATISLVNSCNAKKKDAQLEIRIESLEQKASSVTDSIK